MPRSRLSDHQRAEVIASYRAGTTKADLAAAFGVPLSTIRYHTHGIVRAAEAARCLDALQRELVRHAPMFGQQFSLSPTQQALVRKRWRAGATTAALAATFGVPELLIQHVVDDIDRSPQGVERERARQAAMARAKRGYPKLHAGASAVRITPARGGGCELRISSELYRQLGAPERLDVARHGTRLIFRAGSRYSVVNRGKTGLPRITIGAPTRRTLRLTTDGQFPARVVRRPTLHITVNLNAGTHDDRAAASRPTIADQAGASDANDS